MANLRFDASNFSVKTDPTPFYTQLCDLVRYRLEHEDYLRRPEYGEALLAAFARCREELPIGFAAFHLPWVLEWYTANRQYRAAFELKRDFPLRLPTWPAAAVEYDGAKGVQQARRPPTLPDLGSAVTYVVSR